MSTTKQTRRVTPTSSETLIRLLETLPDALFVVDDADTIVYANARAQAMTGATREDVFGKPLWRCAPHLVSTSLYQAVQKTKQTREPTEVEYVTPVTNIWLHVSLSPTDEGLAIFFHKHLEPPHLQDALSRNGQMYRDLLESFSDGVTILTPDGLVLDINQRPLADAHLRREEVVGKPFTDLPAWSYDPAVQICAGRDITERKHTEDDLRTLVDAIPHFVWMMRPDGSAEYGNQRWCDYTNMTPEQLQGDGWIQCLHPDDRRHVLDAWQTAVRTNTPYEVEHRIQHGSTGDYRWFLARGIPLRDRQGTILRWFGTCTDIDDQKRVEEALRQSQARINFLMDSGIIGIFVSEEDQVVEANETYLRMTGYTREDLRAGSISWLRMTPPEYAAQMQQARQELAVSQQLMAGQERPRAIRKPHSRLRRHPRCVRAGPGGSSAPCDPAPGAG
jgi:PAS domain S-box-containing protein